MRRQTHSIYVLLAIGLILALLAITLLGGCSASRGIAKRASESMRNLDAAGRLLDRVEGRLSRSHGVLVETIPQVSEPAATQLKAAEGDLKASVGDVGAVQVLLDDVSESVGEIPALVAGVEDRVPWWRSVVLVLGVVAGLGLVAYMVGPFIRGLAGFITVRKNTVAGGMRLLRKGQPEQAVAAMRSDKALNKVYEAVK